MKRLFIILTALFFAAPFLCAQETPPPEVVALLEEDPVNEKETLLRGLTPVQGPYYDWSLVRENLAGWQR